MTKAKTKAASQDCRPQRAAQQGRAEARRGQARAAKVRRQARRQVRPDQAARREAGRQSGRAKPAAAKSAGRKAGAGHGCDRADLVEKREGRTGFRHAEGRRGRRWRSITRTTVLKVAAKDKAKDIKPEVTDKDAPEAAPDAPLPLLDLSDAAVKKMIKLAKKRGYVTHEQINAVMPSEEVTSDQIEDVFAMLNEMGINVVENDEQDADEADEARRGRRRGRDRQRTRRGQAEGRRQGREVGAGRAHRRSGAHVSARNGLGRAAVARRRNRHRQAHRGRPRGDDRGPVRKPADVPGHHHLARRTERRQGFPARHHRSRSDLCRPRRQGHSLRSAADGSRRPADSADRPDRGAAADGRARDRARRARRRSAPSRWARKPRAIRPKPPPKATWTKTTWRIPCRSPPSRPS